MDNITRRNAILGMTAAAGTGLVGCSDGPPPVIPEVNGFTAPQFEGLQAAFLGNFEKGFDVGSAVCVTYNDEIVADLWAGWLDAARTKPWQEDSIVNVFSSTKTMTALSALLLADQGELSFDDPVSKYWPEFAENGKADIKVSHFMAHTAGLPTWEEDLEITALYDWEKATSLLAKQTPLWEPGTASGYHAMTQGYLTGEVVRRVTGQSLGEFFAQELAGPMGADFFIGTPASEDSRIADMLPPNPQPIADFFFSTFVQSDMMKRVLSNPPLDVTKDVNGSDWRRAESPAANGHGSARGAAMVQSLLSHGGTFQGKTILSEEGVRRALEEQISGQDLVLGLDLRHGMGYGLEFGGAPPPNESVAFWYGAGGSMVHNDLENRLTITFVMNKMLPGLTMTQRTDALIDAVYAAL